MYHARTITYPIETAVSKYQQELDRLNIALAFQELWPEAFDCGPITSRWVSNGYGELKLLSLRRSDGEYRELTLDQLPEWLVEHGKRFVEASR